MLARDILRCIAECLEIAVTGCEDDAIRGKLDRQGRAPHRQRERFELGVALPALRHVGRELHDPHRATIRVEHRIVGGAKPQLAAILADAAVGPEIELAPAELRPEGSIVGCAGVSGVAEHPVMPPDHLVARIARQAQEDIVGLKDSAVGRELDYRLASIERREPRR